MDKVYKIEPVLGKGKYFFSFHDGETKRKNGRAFWNVMIFRDKKKLNDFEKSLRSEGYTYHQPTKYKRKTMKKHKALGHTFFALTDKVNAKNFKTFLSPMDIPNSDLSDEALEAKIYFIRVLYGKNHGFAYQMGMLAIKRIGLEINRRLMKRVEEKKKLALSVPN